VEKVLKPNLSMLISHGVPTVLFKTKPTAHVDLSV